MTYRDILVQIDERPQSAARAAAAAALAARSDAHLTGVFLKSEFLRDPFVAESLSYMPPDSLQALIDEQDAAVRRAQDAARGAFEAAAAEAGVASDWLVCDGDLDEAMIACARRFDLTVFPPVASVSLGRNRISAADLGLGCGGPVLVLPESGAAPTLGERILIAWKGTRESARALRDAWPLVSRAKETHVLVVSPHGDDGPDGLLQRHLEHHGLQANLIVDRSHDASAGEILRRQAAALKADLVVMGLYGRPRLQELVLGGVSRAMLDDPPCALLMSH